MSRQWIGLERLMPLPRSELSSAFAEDKSAFSRVQVRTTCLNSLMDEPIWQSIVHRKENMTRP